MRRERGGPLTGTAERIGRQWHLFPDGAGEVFTHRGEGVDLAANGTLCGEAPDLGINGHMLAVAPDGSILVIVTGDFAGTVDFGTGLQKAKA